MSHRCWELAISSTLAGETLVLCSTLLVVTSLVSSLVHTQAFRCRVRDWRWFLPRLCSVLPGLPPCSLIATLLLLWGYRLLIAVKPLSASCVLSPAASWQHSNKLFAIQLPCTRGGGPFGPGPAGIHATVVSLIWTSAKSPCQIIHWISGPSWFTTQLCFVYVSVLVMLLAHPLLCHQDRNLPLTDGSIDIYRFIIHLHRATSNSQMLAPFLWAAGRVNNSAAKDKMYHKHLACFKLNFLAIHVTHTCSLFQVQRLLLVWFWVSGPRPAPPDFQPPPWEASICHSL